MSCALAVSGTNLFAGTDGVASFFPPTTAQAGREVNTGLTNTDVCALAVSGTNLFAGTRRRCFLSTNNGTSWTEVNTGLTNTTVDCSCRLRHESLCRDFWRRCLAATLVGDDYLGRPRDHQRAERVLAPAELPQPLQPLDDDPLRLPNRSHVILTSSTPRPAGRSSPEWRQERAITMYTSMPLVSSSGMYLYRLTGSGTSFR